MAARLPTPRYCIQHNRFKKQDGWRLDDLSLSLNRNIAVTGYNENTHRTCIDVYITNVRHSNSRDKPKIIYSKEFEKYTSEGREYWGRRVSFYPGSDTTILSGLGDKLEVTDLIQDHIIKSRKIKLVNHGGITCMSIRETEIFIGFKESNKITVYDVIDLNEIESIILQGIQDGYWPYDMKAIADRIFVCVVDSKGGSNQKSLIFEEKNVRNLSELTKPTDNTQWYVQGLALNITLNAIAVVWSQTFAGTRKGKDVIVFYSLLSENNCSFLIVEVEFGVCRIRISDRGDRMVTGNRAIQECKVYDMSEFISYGHLKENLQSQLPKDYCLKLADYFAIPADQRDEIFKSDTPIENLLLALEGKGVIQPSNVDRLSEAFTELGFKSSCSYLVDFYQQTRLQATQYGRFLATLSAHLTASLPGDLCRYFDITDEKKSSINSNPDPGLSLLLALDEIGIINPSEVEALQQPFSELKLVQAEAKIHEYQSVIEEEKNQLQIQTELTEAGKKELFIQCLKEKIQSWYETMTPVPWKKSCRWKSKDLFVGSGLVLTYSKAKGSLTDIDEECKLKYNQILNHSRLKAEKRIILDGEPGSGKTMMSSQLAYDWSQGKISEVDFLIFLPLKFVNNVTLVVAVKRFYFSAYDSISVNDIESFLTNEDLQSCLILDGLEEYNSAEMAPAGETSEVKKVMERSKYPNSKVILTSRSDSAKDLPVCPTLRIGRFGKKERHTYIEKVFADDTEKQQEIKRVIENNPFILDLCRVPLLFVLAVHNTESIAALQEGQLDRIAPFMDNMVKKLCTLPDYKTEGSLSDSEGIRDESQLEKFAYNGLCKGQQILSWQRNVLEANITNLKPFLDSGILVVEEGIVKGNLRIIQNEKTGGEFSQEKRKTTKNKIEATGVDQMNQSAQVGTGAMATSHQGHSVDKEKGQVDRDPPSREHAETLPLASGFVQLKPESQSEPELSESQKTSNNSTAKDYPLEVKFLHKIMQEWFASKHLSSLLWKSLDDNSLHDFPYEVLPQISPIDLHYILRFTSYLCPPSCYLIMDFLSQNYRSINGVIPEYIVNCICLCFAEYKQDNVPQMTDLDKAITKVSMDLVVAKLCREVIIIRSDDNRIAQQSKVAMLRYAASVGILQKEVHLVDVVLKVDETSTTLASGVTFDTFNMTEVLEMSRWDQHLEQKDYQNIVKLVLCSNSIKKTRLHFPSQPPEIEKEVLGDLVIYDKTVEWIIGPKLIQTLNMETFRWEVTVQTTDVHATALKQISAAKVVAQVEWDYEAKVPDELTIGVGDIITDITVPGHGWWMGNLNRNRGMFPCHCVKVVILNPSKPAARIRGVNGQENAGLYQTDENTSKKGKFWAKVIACYEPQEDDELSLEVNNEKIEVTNQSHQWWWEGIAKGKKGMFPSNYVIVLPEELLPEEEEMEQHGIETPVEAQVMYDYDAIKPDELTIKVGDIITDISVVDNGWWKGVVNGKKGMFPSNYVTVCTGPPGKSSQNKKVLAKVTSSYTPRSDSEASLEEGDIIEITSQQDPFWWEGVVNGKRGHFPSHCVVPILEKGEERKQQDYATPDIRDKTLLSAETTVSNDGGLLQIANTDIKLIIPPDALGTSNAQCLVRMRVIPPGSNGAVPSSFSSHSSAVLELLPNNLRFLQPVELTLPHCLQLKKDAEKKVKIFMSHHEGDAEPRWEEVTDHHYILHEKACTLWLKRFCWTKYEIDDKIVEAKRIQVYTAAKPLCVPDDIAEIEVGYYLDLPGAGEILRLNPSLIVGQRRPFLFLREGNYPLMVSLQKIRPPSWKYSTPEENPKEIPFRNVASSIEYSCPFLLEQDTESSNIPTCIFKATQNQNHLQLLIRPKTIQTLTQPTSSHTTAEVHYRENITTGLDEDSNNSVDSMCIKESKPVVSFFHMTHDSLDKEPSVYRTRDKKEDCVSIGDKGAYQTLEAHLHSNQTHQKQQTDGIHQRQLLQYRGQQPEGNHLLIQKYHYSQHFNMTMIPTSTFAGLYGPHETPWYGKSDERKANFIKYSTLLSIARKLDTKDPLYNDWRMLAGELGFTVEDITLFGRHRSPTCSVITCAFRRSKITSLEHLKSILTKMNRKDAASEITKQQEPLRWKGVVSGKQGHFPSHCVVPIPEDGEERKQEYYTKPELLEQPLLGTEAIVTTNRVTMTIPNTKVVLNIPSGALPEDVEECVITMRLVHRKMFKDNTKTFSSHSSVVVEILPNNLILKRPAQLIIPHCLLLKEKKAPTAKIYMSHHQEGCLPCWEEHPDVKYCVERTHCIVWLKNFCWVTIKVDDKDVLAKHLIMYSCGEKLMPEDKYAVTAVGYYPDLDGERKLLKLNKNMIVSARIPLVFMKEGSYPLCVLLVKHSAEWELWSPQNHLEIAFADISSSFEHLCQFVFKKTDESAQSLMCLFQVYQEKGQQAINLTICPEKLHSPQGLASEICDSSTQKQEITHEAGVANTTTVCDEDLAPTQTKERKGELSIEVEENLIQTIKLDDSQKEMPNQGPPTSAYGTPDAAVRPKTYVERKQNEQEAYIPIDSLTFYPPSGDCQNEIEVQRKLALRGNQVLFPNRGVGPPWLSHPFLQQNLYNQYLHISPYSPFFGSPYLMSNEYTPGQGEVGLRYGVINAISKKLDSIDPLGNDWRQLADKLDFSLDDITNLESAPSSTVAVIECALKSGRLKSHEHLKDILIQIGRSDAASIINTEESTC